MGELFQESLSVKQAQNLSPSALAYIGDAVFELVVRSQLLMPARKIHTYHQDVVSQVKAEAQATLAQKMLPLLTEEELSTFRRARNAAVGKPKRVNLSTYQQATGFEALIGYWYLTNQQRLQDILEQLQDC